MLLLSLLCLVIKVGGIILTIVLGIVGAVVGGFVATLLGFGGISGFDIRSLIIAILGSFIVLFVFGMFANRSS